MFYEILQRMNILKLEWVLQAPMNIKHPKTHTLKNNMRMPVLCGA